MSLRLPIKILLDTCPNIRGVSTNGLCGQLSCLEFGCVSLIRVFPRSQNRFCVCPCREINSLTHTTRKYAWDCKLKIHGMTFGGHSTSTNTHGKIKLLNAYSIQRSRSPSTLSVPKILAQHPRVRPRYSGFVDQQQTKAQKQNNQRSGFKQTGTLHLESESQHRTTRSTSDQPYPFRNRTWQIIIKHYDLSFSIMHRYRQSF